MGLSKPPRKGSGVTPCNLPHPVVTHRLVAPRLPCPFPSMDELRAQLAANSASFNECRTTQIFTNGGEATDTAREATDALEAAAQARSKEEGLQKDSKEAEDLREEVASLRTSLAAADQRTQTVAGCQARQQEIHSTLLTAGYDAAVEAQDEARAETAAVRQQLAKRERDVAAARERDAARLETLQAEVELLQMQRQSEVSALQRALDEARHETTVQRRLLSAELRACERPASQAAMASPPRRAVAPSPAQVLRDLGQWAGATAPAAECSPSGDPRAPRYLQRLQRLEAAADAAGSRFEALQRDHVALKRQHHKLKQRLHERERGAGDGAAATSAVMGDMESSSDPHGSTSPRPRRPHKWRVIRGRVADSPNSLNTRFAAGLEGAASQTRSAVDRCRCPILL